MAEEGGRERIQNDGKLEERRFGGERDHKRQLREKQHPAGDRTHTRTHTRYTVFSLIKKSHKHKLVPQVV